MRSTEGKRKYRVRIKGGHYHYDVDLHFIDLNEALAWGLKQAESVGHPEAEVKAELVE
jgi:hypothetical protein